MTPSRLVRLVVPDLFFLARIQTVAAHVGVEIGSSTAASLADDCRSPSPDLVIVDLYAAGALDAVRALKRDADLAGVRVIGFYSHVDEDTRRAAIDAGIDDALPRSAFTVKLAKLLAG